MNPTLLIVDDDDLVRWSLRERLEEEGYRVVEAPDGESSLERFRNGVDLVLLDYCLPGQDGLETLRQMQDYDADVPVIMMTAHSTVERAVEAMRQGATHYTRKPFDLEEVTLLVEKALHNTRLHREVRRLRQAGAEGGVERIIGESKVMLQAKAMVRKIAESPASTVLITGESGTGKDVVARAIHAQSDRRDFPFMNITCSALPEALLESELFGHERGAFTDAKSQKKGLLEQAAGGTVFLDEVAEMAPNLQAKLLRFLEERVFRRVGGTAEIRPDVRVLAATHQDLQRNIKRGTFRSDLYYRLAVLHLQLPPLRDRGGDVILLANFFVDQFNREFRRDVMGLSPAAVQLLETHGWPGNVRELRNTVERAVLLSEGDVLGKRDFSILASAKRDVITFELPPQGIDMRELERDFVVQALERTAGNQTQAAALLGLTRDQVRYRIAKYKLSGAGADDDDGEALEESDEGDGGRFVRAG